MSKFQVIVLAIFVLCIVGGVTAFALFKGSTNQVQLPSITLWGVLPSDTFNSFVTQINSTGGNLLKINYVQKDPTTFNQDFVQALARGTGPDAILVSQDMILENEDKLLLIPYTALPQRTFLDTYIPEANLYLRTDGITALPFAIDPLIMYWNRDTFTNAGIATAGTISNPLHWSQFPTLVSKITQKDDNANIHKTLVALGQFSNIDHARDVFGTLLLQAGNMVTGRSATDNSVLSALGDGVYQGTNSSSDALSFFIRFTDPTDPLYSWNRSLPDSESFFLSGNLAMYFGLSSELNNIRSKNPNLNFDVAPMPQPDPQANVGQVRTTFGRLYGFSLVKSSPNASAAYSILSQLITPTALVEWTKLTYLPPVRRDMIAAGTTDPNLAIFYDAALISKGWLDPNPVSTAQIMQKVGTMMQ